MPKNEIVIYPNLDLYPSSKDVDVSFYQELYKYKSVQDYLDSKKRRRRKTKKRKIVLAAIYGGGDVNFLDFPGSSDGFPADTGVSGANQIGGLADHVTLSPDEEGRDPYGNLNYSVRNDSVEEQVTGEQGPDQLIQSPKDNPTGIPGGISDFDSENEFIYNSFGYDPDNGYFVTDVGTGI